MLSDFDLNPLVELLQQWYRQNARDLPWRRTRDPYHIWVSEIMLQQTRVEAVKPYYERFIKELPDVKALARCPEDRYLKLWEGLGYYSRVRNLNAAAKQVMEQYDGMIPDTYDELRKLKGIGPYTAGAIASSAFGQPVPAVDGNVLRVISRVTGDDSDIMKESVRKGMGRRLQELMERPQEPRPDPYIFNQALMELGAVVCVPGGPPLCGQCPWMEFCEARKQDRIHLLPVKKKAKDRRIEKRTVFVLQNGSKAAIRRRPEQGLLAGLYELPNCEGHLTREEALQYISSLGCEPLRIRELPEAKHIFSHLEWHMKGYGILLGEPEPGPGAAEGKEAPLLFVESQEAAEKYAIPGAFSRYVKYLGIQTGIEKDK